VIVMVMVKVIMTTVLPRRCSTPGVACGRGGGSNTYSVRGSNGYGVRE
jgi:hypothetical protein